MQQIELVGIGVSTIDFLSLVEYFPAQEGAQQALDMNIQGGGPVATAVITAARLGVKTAMIDAIGDDWRGVQILDEFRKDGVDRQHIKIYKGCSSAMSCILVKKGTGERAIIHRPGSAPDLELADLPRNLIETARCLHVNGRHWKATLEAVRWARDKGVRVSFDGGAGRYWPEVRELVRLSDVCIVARDFAERYTGQHRMMHAAEHLLQEGPSVVVITDGAHGSWVHTSAGDTFHQEAYILPTVVDTTGCGDSYHGAFIFGLLRHFSLRKTASIASAVAALNTQMLGGRAALPSLSQVDSFLASLEEKAVERRRDSEGSF